MFGIMRFFVLIVGTLASVGSVAADIDTSSIHVVNQLGASIVHAKVGDYIRMEMVTPLTSSSKGRLFGMKASIKGNSKVSIFDQYSHSQSVSLPTPEPSGIRTKTRYVYFFKALENGEADITLELLELKDKSDLAGRTFQSKTQKIVIED